MRLRSVLVGCVALLGCTEPGEGGGGGGPGYDREVAGGDRHDERVAGLARDRADLDQVLIGSSPLREAFGDLTARDFTTTTVTLPTAGPRTLTSVFAQQAIDGISVRGAYAYLVADATDAEARLLASAYHLYQGAAVATAPTVSRELADGEARDHLRLPASTALAGELAIWPIDGELQLAWEITADRDDRRALVIASGPRAGRVEVVDDRIDASRGVVTAWTWEGGAPLGRGRAVAQPLPSASVASNGTTALTDAAGRYQLDAAAGASLLAALSGPAAVVRNLSGPTLMATQPAAPQVDFALGRATVEAELAQTTAFREATRAWQFLIDNGVPAAALGAPLTTNVNLADTCNAYFSPASRSINFFRAGGGCRNSAEATIVAHEYGHFVDHAFGGITNSGLSEGWGDTLACLIYRAPTVGGDLFEGGRTLRSCDNTYRYPAGGSDEPHALGQAWAGFAWQVRAGLVAALGEASGDAAARALILPSLRTNAPRIPEAVREVFLRDDDDGDLGNGTPHYALLRAAAERHGLGFVVERDPVPPSQVVDLSGVARSPTVVDLGWTAPGGAARYELRWSTRLLTEATFATGALLPAPTPGAAGHHETQVATVPPAGLIHVALRVIDVRGKTSPLSNIAFIALPAPTVAWGAGAEDGLGGWRKDGLWHVTHRHAAEGAAAYGYGDEATGTYDTGAPNRGALESPVIDLAALAAPKLAFDEWVDVETAPDRDRLRVSVIDASDPTRVVALDKVTGSTGGAFATRLLDLAPLAGRKVRLRFEVDTVDANANRGEGWFVDRVRVFGDGAAPPPPPAAGLVINEILADPPADYDTNGDQVFSPQGDEMIELVNAGAAALDLGGATLADAVAVRATFAAGTALAPGQALVVFGGAARTIPGVVTVGTSGLGLNNDGDDVIVRGADGRVLAQVHVGPEAGRDQSLVRQLDGDGGSALVGHRTVAMAPASPGRKSDGGPFAGGAPAPRLMINEVLADPPAGFDANGDGVASVVDDEFVELINVGAAPLALGGATIADATGVRGRFAAGTTLPPGGALVVFGGGAPALPGVVAVALGALQLNNGGDEVTVRSATGEVLATTRFGVEGGMDQSLTRARDRDPAAGFVLHRSLAAAPASPGRQASGGPL
ncbi:MAG: lamin tail domain-containing protein [Myxococcales bacterium]|nr:lamin tail domain-containing protein [Myxococcales bacterium]